MRRLPKRLKGDIPIEAWLNALLDFVESLILRNSDTVKIQHLNTCTIAHASPPSAPATPEGTFRGDWDGTYSTSYDAQDIVKISNGQEAGTYIAIEPIPADDSTRGPWTGNGWVLIGRVNDQSNWGG